MPDKYSSFKELAANERRGQDFDFYARPIAGSKSVVIAPHGGTIEPGTSRIAEAIAGSEFSYYWFKALKPGSGLHITSHRFDEPTCVALVREHKYVVSIHGWRIDGVRVCAGGLDQELMRDMNAALAKVGIALEKAEGSLRALDANNITNRGASGAGVQFELSMSFRKSAATLARFQNAIREVLLKRQTTAA